MVGRASNPSPFDSKAPSSATLSCLSHSRNMLLTHGKRKHNMWKQRGISLEKDVDIQSYRLRRKTESYLGKYMDGVGFALKPRRLILVVQSHHSFEVF